MAYRVIQVGTGGWGEAWCRRFLPPNIADGHIEVVAAVDTSPAALENARTLLSLPAERCYTDVHTAMRENPADFCTIVTPPWTHEAVVDAALHHNLHILSEKPIADTLDGAVRIAAKVRAADRKMAVTMSHRFDQDKTTLRGELRSGRAGPLDYLMCRFTCDYRQRGVWGAFRHDMADPLIIEGAVHHLDILADLAHAPCDTLYAQTWNPPWGEYAGDSQALVTMHFENGTRAVYEGAKTNAVGLNDWSHEYVRCECRDATLILNQRAIEQFRYDPATQRRRVHEGNGESIALLEQPKWSNAWLVEQFVEWLDGGPPMETNVADNLQSMALIAAALESSRTGQPKRVQELLHRAQQRVN